MSKREDEFSLREDVRRALCKLEGGSLRRLIFAIRTPGVKAVVAFRFGQWLGHQAWFIRIVLSPLYYFFRYRVLTNWGIDIPREARIGAGLYIAHFGGIIISPAAKIGRNLDISQGVTIGLSGEGEKRGVPIITPCEISRLRPIFAAGEMIIPPKWAI